MVNDELKNHGIKTWFDSEEMAGNIVDAMSKGIDNSKVILAFVTKQYHDKVGGDNTSDNCKKEFEYAVRRRTIKI